MTQNSSEEQCYALRIN